MNVLVDDDLSLREQLDSIQPHLTITSTEKTKLMVVITKELKLSQLTPNTAILWFYTTNNELITQLNFETLKNSSETMSDFELAENITLKPIAQKIIISHFTQFAYRKRIG